MKSFDFTNSNTNFYDIQLQSPRIMETCFSMNISPKKQNPAQEKLYGKMTQKLFTSNNVSS